MPNDTNGGADTANNSVSRLLVVDDDVVSREFLTTLLTRWGFEVMDAESVRSAQRLLAARDLGTFDCVITDYRMPDLSGLDLLSWIREWDPSLATIFLTGEGRNSIVLDSFRGGVVDFLPKPVEPKLLREAIQNAVARTKKERQMARMASAVQDLGRAQRWMLNSNHGGGQSDVALFCHPKLDAGGDFFSHVQLSPSRDFFLLTDVSGHDLQAAYVSAYFQGIVRGMLERDTPPWKIFRYFNHFLLEEWQKNDTFRPGAQTREVSLSATAVSVDLQEQTATALTSGAPAPVYLTPGGYAQRLGQSGGSPLGWFPDASISALTYGIGDGGDILMWSDGLEDLAHARNVDPLAVAYRWQRAKAAGSPFPLLNESDDDVLMARIRLSGGCDPTSFHPLALEEYDAADIGKIDEWMDRWRRSVRLAIPGISESVEHDLALASREAVLNALQHGCRDCPQYPVSFQIGYRSSDNLLRTWVQDPGPGHEEHLRLDEPGDELGGAHFGLQLIKRLPRAVKFEQQGASVTMDFNSF